MAYTFKQRIKRKGILLYHALGVDKLLVFFNVGPYNRLLSKAFACFLSNEENNDLQLKKSLYADIKRCYYKYLITPQEYFLFGFKDNKNNIYRNSFLSDNVKIRTLIKVTGEKRFVEELTDKMGFYKLCSKYFHRRCMQFDANTDKDAFMGVFEGKAIFAKVMNGSFGSGAITFDTADYGAYEKLKKAGATYIVEERISQSIEMAKWNQSSVNTIRVPTFLHDGSFEIVKPVLRTGRLGSIVDNAGGGGIISCINVDTGIIESGGNNENGIHFETHPDSGIRFVGWKIPRWEELKILVEEIHRNCMPHHRYIGWDFALTDDGWVLIEGNWGQFLSQYVDKIGLKSKFMDCMYGCSLNE